MSDTEDEYDKQFWDMFTEMLVRNGCPQDKADEFREDMRHPRKRTYGDLTVREVWNICHAHPRCKGCPFGNDLCMAFLWHRPEEILNEAVDL